jgi:hypothetical protein
MLNLKARQFHSLQFNFQVATVAHSEPIFWPTELEETKTEKEISAEVKIIFFCIRK